MNFMMYWWGIKYLKNILCFIINEISQYDTSIAFKQKWVRKYWILTTMEHMEIKEIHNYAIDLNNWLDKKPIQWTKLKV
jgi:hypothetical protein